MNDCGKLPRALGRELEAVLPERNYRAWEAQLERFASGMVPPRELLLQVVTGLRGHENADAVTDKLLGTLQGPPAGPASRGRNVTPFRVALRGVLEGVRARSVSVPDAEVSILVLARVGRGSACSSAVPANPKIIMVDDALRAG